MRHRMDQIQQKRAFPIPTDKIYGIMGIVGRKTGLLRIVPDHFIASDDR